MSRKAGSASGGKQIVIVGAGFGGIRAALDLEKKLKGQAEITLVDKRDYHLFTSNLYEVAASEQELTSVSQMKKSITLPIEEIFKGTKVNFIQSEVKSVNTEEKKVVLASKQLSYDYLVLALGSQSDFFGIKGADKYSMPLKTLADGLRIRNKLEFEVQSHRQDANKKVLRVVVAGGGYTGLEFASEAKGLMDILSIKYNYPREKIEIEVVEASSKLVPGFDDRLSMDALYRLRDLGIKVNIAARISEVDEHFVYLMSGEKVAYDALVWTTGVKANPMECNLQISIDGRGKICVNEFLQSQRHPEIFALGDMAAIYDSQKKLVPATAQDAIHEGEYLAYSLYYIMQNKLPPKPYMPKKHGFIVSLGGKWAIMSYGGMYATGFFAWAIDQLAHTRYYMSVVGFWKGVKYMIFQLEMYGRND